MERAWYHTIYLYVPGKCFSKEQLGLTRDTTLARFFSPLETAGDSPSLRGSPRTSLPTYKLSSSEYTKNELGVGLFC